MLRGEPKSLPWIPSLFFTIWFEHAGFERLPLSFISASDTQNHTQCWCFSVAKNENSCVEVYAVCGTTQLSQICSFTCHVAWHHGIIKKDKIAGEIHIESAEKDLTDWCKHDELMCMVYKVSKLFQSSQGRISSTKWLVWIEIMAYPADPNPTAGGICSLHGWEIPTRPPRP